MQSLEMSQRLATVHIEEHESRLVRLYRYQRDKQLRGSLAAVLESTMS